VIFDRDAEKGAALEKELGVNNAIFFSVDVTKEGLSRISNLDNTILYSLLQYIDHQAAAAFPSDLPPSTDSHTSRINLDALS